ncbi:MAG: hypothetical protein IIT81_00280 [Mycoplasmataceae bacterium]|nr:hypothetical protein [Mycoplasmataceae bacterium]
MLKGSQIRDKLTESASKLERIINSREKYKDKIDSNWQLKEDCFFKMHLLRLNFLVEQV